VATVARTRSKVGELADVVRAVAGAFRKHSLSAHTGAIAFRLLVALVPLVLLGLALLGALGLEDVWRDSLAPAVQERVSSPVFTAIDYSVEEIFASGSAGLLAFASLLLLWELTRAVRAVTLGLNAIHDVGETRSRGRLVVTTLALAVACGVGVVGSLLSVIVVPRLGVEGVAHVLLTILAWAVAVALLGVVVGLLVRYAPAEQPSASWASAGSALVVGTWVIASLAFGWWAGSVANYKSAVGSLTVFLLLTAYVLVSAGIFLIGVEVDELGREESRG
jgi:membrane protein